VALIDDHNDEDGSTTRKVVVMFEEGGHTAVLDVDLLAQGVIAFGVNSWRGDRYEGMLRDVALWREEDR
jgi:hypothetical protein